MGPLNRWFLAVGLGLLLAALLPGLAPKSALGGFSYGDECGVALHPIPEATPGNARWSGLFGPYGANGNVYALAVAKDGTVYAAGEFTFVNQVRVNYIAQYKDGKWKSLGDGVDRPVCSLAIGKDGFLYVGGTFSRASGKPANRVARWSLKGQVWSSLGSGLEGGDPDWTCCYPPGVYVLQFDRKGNLFAGGQFDHSGNTPLKNLARWTGSAWTDVGGGVAGGVHDLRPTSVYAIAFDSKNKLFIGGEFGKAGDVHARRIAKWNGKGWLPLGTGMEEGVNVEDNPATVYSLAFDGQGDLYAGGNFAKAGGIVVHQIARWDGTAWHALAGGVSGVVNALVIDPGGNVYAGGDFDTADATNAPGVAVWDGGSWHALGTGLNNFATALALDKDGNLLVGGTFSAAGDKAAHKIARWDGSSWSALGSGKGMSGQVFALTHDSAGNVYAGGRFATADSFIANAIARWDGETWYTLGTGMNAAVNALAVGESGHVFAGGDFTQAGGVAANHIAEWDGSQWLALGSGIEGEVRALVVDGSGILYAGGEFSEAGGMPVSNVAMWDGSQWHAVGGSMGKVNALAVGPDGTIYAGGMWHSVAYWDGNDWQAIGDILGREVFALAFDSHGNLYAGKQSKSNATTFRGIARWDGTKWHNVGAGISWASGDGGEMKVYALAVGLDDAIYAGGFFTRAGNTDVNYIARWKGQAWERLGQGTGGIVYALTLDSQGNLFVGGQFESAGGKASNWIAKWRNAP